MSTDDAETGLMPTPRHTSPLQVIDPSWERMKPLLWDVFEAREAVNYTVRHDDPHRADALRSLVAALEAALGQAVACLGFTEGSTND